MNNSQRAIRAFYGFLTLLVVILNVESVDAQSRKKKEAPAPETVTLVTKDKVEIKAEFFGGTKDKDSVPLILVHDWDGNRRQLLTLAGYLQKEHGHAVIVPDLRGHGDSLTVQYVEDQLDRSRFRKKDIETVVNDIDACRKFLEKKNNEGKLNLDMLTVVGLGKSCPIVAAWCIIDWQWPPFGGVKQGQNVKAVVMISPERKFKGISMTPSIKSFLFNGKGGKPLSVLLSWGSRNSKTNKEGKEIFESMDKSRPEFTAQSVDERWEKQTLFRIAYSSSARSDALLQEQSEKLYPAIATFIDKKIVAQKDDFRWQNRERK